jgi:glycosyltransferase involved in cell wall biosynthesis
MENPMLVSLVIPCYNEEENLPRLFDEVSAVIDGNNLTAEVILVDDGSSDKTPSLIKEKAANDPRFHAVVFRRNFGQTAAMVAGIDASKGDVIIPLDADLQNDPADIPRLLEKIDDGYDVVSGWRKARKDTFISRRLPSIMANWLISRVGGVHIHDYGCTLKAYRRSVISEVKLYGEMHRFIPIYAAWAGASVTEIVVNHRPRIAGESKYGIGRTFKVLLDLLTVKLLGSYATKPIYFFGGIGMLFLLLGFSTVSFSIIQPVLASILPESLSSHRFSILLLGAFFAMVGIQSTLLGLLAELQVRTYHESQAKPIYLVEEPSEEPLATAPTEKSSETAA